MCARVNQRGARWIAVAAARMADGIIENAWNPDTGGQDFKVVVDGGQLEFLQRYSLPGFHDARHIPATVREPDAVFESGKGEWVYFKSVESLTEQVRGRIRRSLPPPVFAVRVRKTGNRAYLWDFEAGDPGTPGLPLDRRRNRFTKKLR